MTALLNTFDWKLMKMLSVAVKSGVDTNEYYSTQNLESGIGTPLNVLTWEDRVDSL